MLLMFNKHFFLRIQIEINIKLTSDFSFSLFQFFGSFTTIIDLFDFVQFSRVPIKKLLRKIHVGISSSLPSIAISKLFHIPHNSIEMLKSNLNSLQIY